MNVIALSFVLVVGIFGIQSFPVSAQTFGYMKKTTSGGTLDVLVQAPPGSVIKNSQTTFKVTFEQKASDKVQPHIDYDVIIMRNGKQIFQATALAGHPNQPLHTTEGIVTLPYNFQDSGEYLIKVSVDGMLFIPINPEFTEFPINVT